MTRHDATHETRYDQKVEWCQVQSLVRRPYAEWLHSAHLVLTIQDTAKARDWLRKMQPDIRFAGDIYGIEDPQQKGPKADEPLHFNIAFTVSGLRKLGVQESDLQTFDSAFYEGMAPEPVQPDLPKDTPQRRALIRKQGTTRRAGILGDIAENHSSNWLWGGTKTAENGLESETYESRVLQDQVDILLMVFAQTPELVHDHIKTLQAGDNGVVDAIQSVRNQTPSNHTTFLSDREHFGFKDGISQPLFPDSHKAKKVSARWREFHQVATGEFVLGYLNERNARPESPMLDWNYASGMDLPQRRSADGKPDPTRLDFGRNGTYLVARQLEQNVEAFDRLVENAANLIRTDVEVELPRRQAAELLIGRGVDGEPLVADVGPAYEREAMICPVHPGDQGDQANLPEPVASFEYNDFGYNQVDPAGLSCPIGSHVRRTNPRDSLDPGPDAALNLSKQHRILRRGRIYGKPLDWRGFLRHKLPTEEDTAASPPERGLFFICLNSDIAGQFEFIQDTWVNNPNFGDLEGERDAILAASIDAKVSLPAKPFTRWMSRDVPPVVTVRGGAYFFMPGRKALQALTLRDDARTGNLGPGTVTEGQVADEGILVSGGLG